MSLNQNKLTKAEIAALSVEDLLDLDIDQIEEVTPFVPKPTGIYNFAVTSTGLEEVGDGHAIQVVYTITECVELEDEEMAEDVGELPKEYKENYFIGGESDYGIKAFRTIFGALEVEGTKLSTRDLMEASVGTTGQGLLQLRKYKDKTTKEVKQSNSWEPTSITLS